MNLPEEYLQFLKDKKQLDLKEIANYYEPALLDINYLPKEELKVAERKIHGRIFEGSLDPEKPEQTGKFILEYVDLTSYNNFLVWYPQLKCFGQFDGEHGYFFGAKNKEWKDIVAQPAQYLKGMFEWDEGWHNILDVSKEKNVRFEADEPVEKKEADAEYDFVYEQKHLHIVSLEEKGSSQKITVITDDKLNVIFYYKNGEKCNFDKDMVVAGIDEETNKVRYKSSLHEVSFCTLVPPKRKDIVKEELVVYKTIKYILDKDLIIYNFLNKIKKRNYEFDGMIASSNYSDSNIQNMSYLPSGRTGKKDRVYVIENTTYRDEFVVVCDGENKVLKILERHHPIKHRFQVIAPYNEENESYSPKKRKLPVGKIVVLDHPCKCVVYRPQGTHSIFKIIDCYEPGEKEASLDLLEMAYANFDKPETAAKHLKACLAYPDDFDATAVLTDLGTLHFSIDLEMVLDYFLKAKASAEKEEEFLHPVFYVNFALLYVYQGNYKEGLETIREGIEKYEATVENYTSMKTKLTTLMGVEAHLFILTGEYKKGIKFLEENRDFDDVSNNLVVDATLLTFAYQETEQLKKMSVFKEYLTKNVKAMDDKNDIILCKNIVDKINDFTLDFV